MIMKTEQRKCALVECDNQITIHLGRKENRSYCSVQCVRIARSQIVNTKQRIAWEANPAECPCGNLISYELRYLKHCTPECRTKFQKKKAKDPQKYVTFNCETCDEEVTRYQYYGGGACRFCSMECASKHTKKVVHLGIRDSDVVLDSNYEALFWSVCKFLKQEIERFDRQNCVPVSTGWYGPDFLVKLRTGPLFVEVKGFETDRSRNRCEVFRQEGNRLAIVKEKDLDRIRMIKTRTELEALLIDLAAGSSE